MKEWTTPQINELLITATEYSAAGGHQVDGMYTSTDGQYTIPTYGPSGSNDGTPRVSVSAGGPSVTVE